MKKKPKLKLVKKQIVQVDCFDLERFVKELYPEMRDWSFVATEECGNDVTITHKVTKDFDYDDDEEAWESMKNGNWMANTHDNRVILVGLCRDGLIPAGDYNIKVCW